MPLFLIQHPTWQHYTHIMTYRVRSRGEELERLETGAAVPRKGILGAGLDEVDDLGIRLGSHGFDSVFTKLAGK